jgi:putative oxidoreductase
MIPERYAPVTYALFRIISGYVFLLYGLQKTAGWFGGTQVSPLSWPQGPAGVIETVCGLLIMLGLFTRPAAFLASGEMAVAYFYVHVMQLGQPPMGPGGITGLFVPQMNKGIDSALFCFIFLYIATRGSGIWSVDSVMGKSKGR